MLESVKNQFEGLHLVRRGICLLNAGDYGAAEKHFHDALQRGYRNQSVCSYLAASLLGQCKVEAAAAEFAGIVDQDTHRPTARIRHALCLWKVDQPERALAVLREGIRLSPDCAELHCQLGAMLSSQQRFEEAELCFKRTLQINPDHGHALVGLALCYGLRQVPSQALPHLRRAQAKRPHDAKIGLLLAQACRAVRQQGLPIRVRARMPDDRAIDSQQQIEELSRVIEAEPDFVDAFLTIPFGEIDDYVFAVLLKTLQRALERQPEQAELHYHCGRVLERLGRSQEAIDCNERAVQIEPGFTRALIELGRLYRKTDRWADAMTRLEQAVAAGARYADVYYLLGNLYREGGRVLQAKKAYARAVHLNSRYEEAVNALQALPV